MGSGIAYCRGLEYGFVEFMASGPFGLKGESRYILATLVLNKQRKYGNGFGH